MFRNHQANHLGIMITQDVVTQLEQHLKRHLLHVNTLNTALVSQVDALLLPASYFLLRLENMLYLAMTSTEELKDILEELVLKNKAFL